MLNLKLLSKTSAIALALSIPSLAKADLCANVSSAATAVGATAAISKEAILRFGYAALPHSSGPAILANVGQQGSGYMARTLGGIAATGLSLLGSPYVIIGGTVVAVGGAGTYAYCYFTKD